MKPTKPTTCPVCDQPLMGGKCAIVRTVNGVPISERVHYPDCYDLVHPTARAANRSARLQPALL